MRTLAPPFLFTAIFMALGARVCHSQAHQFVLDTVSDQTWIIDLIGQGVTSTEDGGTVLHLTTDQGAVQWKMDPSGQPVWCKHYGISSQRRARMPDGGIVFCEITGHIQDGDTTHVQLRVVRTDVQGSVVWSKLMVIDDPYSNFFNSAWLYIASNDDGECLITMSALGGSAYQCFYCLDMSGQLLWSRNFLFNLNADHVEHICSDGFGGWYFGSYDWGASEFRLGRLDFFGNMAWYNSYAIPAPQEFWLGGICSTDFQLVAVGGYEAVFGEVYRWFVMRLNVNGSLDWFMVSSAGEPRLSQCMSTNAGELLVSGGQNGYQFYMAQLSGTGTVVSSYRADTVAVGGTEYATWLCEWDLLDTTLTFGNYLRSQAEGGGSATYQPAVWQIPVTDLSACGTQSYDLSSVLLSNSVVTVNDQPSSTVVVPVTITDTVCTVTSFTPIGVSDYCYYFTGIPAVQKTASLGRVLTTLLVPGEPITAMAPSARCGITVHDARGRMLYQGLLEAHGTGSIPTSAWVPGLYFVRFQPEDGGRPNVVKVAIK